MMDKSVGKDHCDVAILVLAGVLILPGCQATTVNPPSVTNPPAPTATLTDTPTPTPTATQSPPPTPALDASTIGPESYPPDVNPLTGLSVPDPAVLARRPLLIKISNAPPVVRPQSGIGSADIIFEHYAEGGQTRFSAIFYSQGVSHVGSVRSTRLIDLQLAPAYDAILVFSGGSLGVIDTLRQSPLYPYDVISPQFGYGPPYFVRFPRQGLPFEHTLFSDTSELWQWTQDRKVRQQPKFSSPGMAFRQLTPSGGSPATSASIHYIETGVDWRYDALSGDYLRWTDGVPHRDALTGAQLAFENVIALSAYHEEVDLFPEKYFGTEKSIYIELQGEGPITLLRDGQAFEGRWHRKEPKDMLTFSDASGGLLYLKPGKTFFQVIRVGFERLLIDP
jgi:Protein of unknown function (DUF3048) N-terminal domain/Protein of unknown function (DUF3048) C-terminal domain